MRSAHWAFSRCLDGAAGRQTEDKAQIVVAAEKIGRWDPMPGNMLESFFTRDDGKVGDIESNGVEKRSEASRCPQRLRCQGFGVQARTFGHWSQ
jgi:hypothetical protein